MRLVDGRILVRGCLRQTATDKEEVEPVHLGALVKLQGPSSGRREGKKAASDTAPDGAPASDGYSRCPPRREYSFHSRMQLQQDQKQNGGGAKRSTGDLEGQGTVTVELSDAGAPDDGATGAAADGRKKKQKGRAATQGLSSSSRGTISGRLLQPYRRKEAEEMLAISDQLPGCEAWRVLPEVQRLLYLRRGRLCCRQKGRQVQLQEEEDCMRECLARLAALKLDIASSASELLQKEAEESASEAAAARHSGRGASGVLLTENSAAAAVAARRASLEWHQQQLLTQDRQRLQQHGRRLTSTGETSTSFLDRLLDALEHATAYSTRGKTHPAVYIQIASLRPLLIYEVLTRWQVQLLLLHIFQRLWLQFAAYSVRRGVRVSSALLVLDFSGLTQAECTSSAVHWLMTDLRNVLKACCPLLVQSVVFCGCQLAKQYLWETLRPVLNIEMAFVTVCETPEELAAHVEAERPFVYHQLLDAAFGSDTLHDWLPYVGAVPELAAAYEGSSRIVGPALLQVPVPTDACRDSATAWLEGTVEDLLQLLLEKRADDAAAPVAADSSERTLACRLLRIQYSKARDAAAATADAAARVLTKTSVRTTQLAALALTPVLWLDQQQQQQQKQSPLQQDIPKQLHSHQQQPATKALQRPLQTEQGSERDVPSLEALQQQQTAARQLWMSLEHRESCCFWQLMQSLEEEADSTVLQQQQQPQEDDFSQGQQHRMVEEDKRKHVVRFSPHEDVQEKYPPSTPSSGQRRHGGVAGESPEGTVITLSEQRSAAAVEQQEQQSIFLEAEEKVKYAARSHFGDFLRSLDRAVVAAACASWHRHRLAAGLSAGISSFPAYVREGAIKHQRPTARRPQQLDLDKVSRCRVSFRSLLEPVF